MSKDGKCIQCGAQLPEGSGKKRQFCPECRAARKAQSEEERRKIAQARKYFAAVAIPPKPDFKSLDQMVKEAHALQLTYGQYSALIASGGLQRYCQYHGLKMPK